MSAFWLSLGVSALGLSCSAIGLRIAATLGSPRGWLVGAAAVNGAVAALSVAMIAAGAR
jgi:hypothetical protein